MALDELVTSIGEIRENIWTMSSFDGGNSDEVKFHRARIKNGKNFIALKYREGYLFSPSKFAGYVGNGLDHGTRLSSRDGRVTDRRISSLLGPAITRGKTGYATIDHEFLRYCGERDIIPSRHHKARTYWIVEDGPRENQVFPDEVNARSYPEGARVAVWVNRYERDPKAREECIRMFGPTCSACEINFEKIYGTHGAGFIHVHHLVPLSEIKQTYEVDPAKDLRPVCPNCHAMLHRNGGMSIDALRALLAQQPRANR
jgi:5-methylcytosine-specific restriction protein A